MNNTKTKLIIGLLSVSLVATIAGSYAYYATIKGKNVNEVAFSTATFTYTEPQESLKSQALNDADGISQDNYYDYTIKGTYVGKAVAGKYYGLTSFVEEEEGNTIDTSNVKVYVTDTNNFPTEEYMTELDTILITSPNGNVSKFSDYENGSYAVSSDTGKGSYEGTPEDYILSDSGNSSVTILEKVNSEEYNATLDIKRCIKYDGLISNITEVDMTECDSNAYTLEKNKVTPKDLKTVNNVLTYITVYHNQMPYEKTFRLRLWIDENSYTSSSTTTSTENSVSIGASGIFKYRVSVGIDEGQGKG